MGVLSWKWRQVWGAGGGARAPGKKLLEPLGKTLGVLAWEWEGGSQAELTPWVWGPGTYLGDRVKLMRVTLVEISGV